MYGTQAGIKQGAVLDMFENDVNMYGTQAAGKPIDNLVEFENDVNT